MERLTYFDGGKWRLKIGDTEYSGEVVDRLAAYEDTVLETVYLEFDGECHTVSEWANILGINRSTLNNRVHRGWPVEKALGRGNYRVSAD